jgi:uncharacterized protein (TIGR02996 family)
MTEREALLAAVCEHPDDDTPRLVFADWLDEHGEPDRAEFIRLQCLRAKGDAPWEEYRRWLMRELELWEAHGDHWLAELPSCPAPELDWGGLFERGFAGEMLTVRAVQRVGPGYAYIEYEGTDCAALDWKRLLWSAPITRLSLWHLENWAVVFGRPEAVRLKCVVLLECGVEIDTTEPLLLWAGRAAGHLIVKQERLALGCGRQLHAAFGDRFEWRRPLDVY